MNQPRHDIWQLADKIQMDLRAAQAKLVELRSMLAGLDLPDETKATCPRCGLKFRGPNILAEHLHISHNGPTPQHWLAAEARSLDPDSEKTRATAGADEEPDLG